MCYAISVQTPPLNSPLLPRKVFKSFPPTEHNCLIFSLMEGCSHLHPLNPLATPTYYACCYYYYLNEIIEEIVECFCDLESDVEVTRGRDANCNCNCNWGTCIVPPTGRPKAHHIKDSIRILVPVNRMKQKCFQITTKRVRRSQQFQLRR